MKALGLLIVVAMATSAIVTPHAEAKEALDCWRYATPIVIAVADDTVALCTACEGVLADVDAGPVSWTGCWLD